MQFLGVSGSLLYVCTVCTVVCFWRSCVTVRHRPPYLQPTRTPGQPFITECSVAAFKQPHPPTSQLSP